MRFGLKRKTESTLPAPEQSSQQSQTPQVPQAAAAQSADQAPQGSAPDAPAATATQQKEQPVTDQRESGRAEGTQASQQTAEKPEKRPAEKKSAVNPAPKGQAGEKRKGDTGAKLVAGANALRTRIANIVWLVAVVCALVLAIGALLVALKMNQDNAIVAFIVDTARALDFGAFKEFTGKNAGIKSALVNWGIAAVVYLVVGKVLDRIIRP